MLTNFSNVTETLPTVFSSASWFFKSSTRILYFVSVFCTFVSHIIPFVKIVTIVVQCTECSSQFSDRQALDKYLQRKHNIYPKVPNLGCFQCSQERKRLPSLRKHSLLTHQQPIFKVCYTCRIGFQSKLEYANHVGNYHGLPIYDMDLNEIHISTPTLSSINGGVNYYEFEPKSNDIDIME